MIDLSVFESSDAFGVDVKALPVIPDETPLKVAVAGKIESWAIGLRALNPKTGESLVKAATLTPDLGVNVAGDIDSREFSHCPLEPKVKLFFAYSGSEPLASLFIWTRPTVLNFV